VFSFKSVGHFFASVTHDVKVGLTFLANHQAQIDTGLATGAALLSTADPALAPIASQIERASEAALGEVLAAVSKVTDAAGAGGVSVSLDTAAVAEFKQLIAAIEKLKPGTVATAAALQTTLSA
jgi:hypothetical protein